MVIIQVILAMFVLEYIAVKVINKISNGQFFNDLGNFIEKLLS